MSSPFAAGVRTAALGICAAGLCLVGCGGSDNVQDVGVVTTTVYRWAHALEVGDGRTYCALLSARLRARRDQEAAQLGRELHQAVTCAQLNSARPPGLDRRALSAYTYALSSVGRVKETVRLCKEGGRWLIARSVAGS